MCLEKESQTRLGYILNFLKHWLQLCSWEAVSETGIPCWTLLGIVSGLSEGKRREQSDKGGGREGGEGGGSRWGGGVKRREGGEEVGERGK